MDKIVIIDLPRQHGKTFASKLLEGKEVVIIDDNTGTHVETLKDRRHDITYEIKNYYETPEQQAKIKQQNPYANGVLKKKKKGGFKRF